MVYIHFLPQAFERLLNKQSYDELLKEHLEGYVEEVVRRKYHILKTSDNFYIYKMDNVAFKPQKYALLRFFVTNLTNLINFAIILS